MVLLLMFAGSATPTAEYTYIAFHLVTLDGCPSQPVTGQHLAPFRAVVVVSPAVAGCLML